MRTKAIRPVVAFPETAVLDTKQVAQALGVSVESVEKMDLPCFWIGRLRRFVWKQVLEVLQERAA